METEEAKIKKTANFPNKHRSVKFLTRIGVTFSKTSKDNFDSELTQGLGRCQPLSLPSTDRL